MCTLCLQTRKLCFSISNQEFLSPSRVEMKFNSLCNETRETTFQNRGKDEHLALTAIHFEITVTVRTLDQNIELLYYFSEENVIIFRYFSKPRNILKVIAQCHSGDSTFNRMVKLQELSPDEQNYSANATEIIQSESRCNELETDWMDTHRFCIAQCVILGQDFMRRDGGFIEKTADQIDFQS